MDASDDGLKRRGWVRLLAFSGLIPFAALAALSMAGFAAAVDLFQIYGLAITCFLLGSWWGVGLSAPSSGRAPLPELLWSNGLLLVAVASYCFVSVALAVTLQGILFAVILGLEHRLDRLRRAPSYYRRLRNQVTVATCVIHGMLAAAIGGLADFMS